VRLIKPNLIASHDWHVQPICQRSLRAIRLSETPWIEVRTKVRIVLELDAQHCFSLLNNRLQRFGANFSRLSKQRAPVKLYFHRTQVCQPNRAAQKNQRSSRAKRARATKARGRTSSRVMQWLVLSREFPTGANGGALDRPQLTQRTSSITLASHFPQTGQARKLCSGPPGGSTTHLQLD
jgi:hypothetical protein